MSARGSASIAIRASRRCVRDRQSIEQVVEEPIGLETLAGIEPLSRHDAGETAIEPAMLGRVAASDVPGASEPRVIEEIEGGAEPHRQGIGLERPAAECACDAEQVIDIVRVDWLDLGDAEECGVDERRRYGYGGCRSDRHVGLPM